MGFFGRAQSGWGPVLAGVALVIATYAPPGVAAVSSLATATAFTCSLATQDAATPQQAQTPRTSEDATCLVSRSALAGGTTLVDLRSRQEYLDFHIPGAENASASALITRPGAGSQPLIVYDSGKFRSDAFLLCDRLRKGGMAHVQVLDGGIASWAQGQNHPNRFVVSRLDDREVAASLFSPTSVVQGLSADLRKVLGNHPISPPPKGGAKTDRVILIADSGAPLEEIQTALDQQKKTAFYWVGSPDQLDGLLSRHIAQNDKRLAGPAEAAACGAL